MFLEMFKPKVIDVYRTGDGGKTEVARVKIRLDETGKLTPLTLNLTFENESQLNDFIVNLLLQTRLKNTIVLEDIRKLISSP